MKKTFILTTLMLSVIVASASNKLAKDYFDAKEYQKAKTILQNLASPDCYDAYMLGEIYYQENKTDSALAAFQYGLTKNPQSAYDRIGVAKMTLAKNTKQLDKTFKAISKEKTNKKNVDVLLAIAEAYNQLDNKEKADYYYAKAKKANKKSALLYIYKAYQSLDKDDNNDAAAKFENAIYFDPNAKLAYVKLAKLYENIRTQVAFDYLKKAIDIDPEYAYGLSVLGELGYRQGFYPEALAAYKKYIEVVKPTNNDLQKYVEILFFNKKYNEALEIIEDLPSDNYVLKRLKFYSLNELKDYDKALTVADDLIANTDTAKLIFQDYDKYAKLLTQKALYNKAAEAYLNAYGKDTTKNKLVAKAASSFIKGKDYDNAIASYKRAIDINPAHTLADIFMYGRSFYIAGTQKIDSTSTVTPEDKEVYLAKADSVFATIEEKVPENYLGSFWRARTNSALDPETSEGLAKPHYEKTITLLDPVNNKSELLECYRYLGFYYFVKKEYKTSLEYWDKVLEIAPDDATANNAKKGIEANMKKKRK